MLLDLQDLVGVLAAPMELEQMPNLITHGGRCFLFIWFTDGRSGSQFFSLE
jgi:hypothetical protein